MVIFKQFTFDSAHFLPNVPEDHKCRQIHGHTYKLTIFIAGDIHDHLGWVMDFSDIKDILEPIVKSVDHKLLNNIEGLENPTCEILAAWLWQKISTTIPGLKKLELYETPTSGAVIEV